MYFDSHAHYDDAQFNPDRDALLESLPEAGVDYVIDCPILPAPRRYWIW